MKLSNTCCPCLVALIIAAGSSSNVAGADDLGVIVGGDFGRAKINYDLSRYEGELLDQAASFGTLDFKTASPHTRTNSWWADAGFLIWPNFGIDAIFLHLGELTNRNTGTYTPTGSSSEALIATTALRSTGPALAALIRLPVMESLSLDFRLGDYLARTSLINGVDLSSYSVTSQTSRDSSLLAGVSAVYNFAGSWSARLDYLRVNRAGDSKTTGTYNADLVSVGLSYTF